MRHGTRSAYNHDGCRCDPCTKANADYLESWRRRRGMKPQKYGREHGLSCYSGGCRCAVGRAANAARMRRYRSKAA